MGDEGISRKEQTRPSSPHPLQKRRIKPFYLAPVDPQKEDSTDQDERSSSRSPSNQDVQRRPSPHPSTRQNVVPPQAAVDGSEDKNFKRTKDRKSSPHPNQLKTDNVKTEGKRSPDFMVPEAVIETGAVGGSVTNVDVHTHGEVKQAMDEHSKGGRKAPGPSTQQGSERVPEGSGLYRTITRIKKYIWRRGPKPIPDTLPPIDDSYAKSASHPSLASESLGIPSINYSISDSEISSEKPEVRRPPSTSSEETEDPNRRAASAPEAMEESESEDPKSRRAKSAAAVLETSQVSDYSDSEDDEGGRAESLRDKSSDPVSVGGTDPSGGKATTSPTELESIQEDMRRIQISEEAGLPSPQDPVSSPSATPQPGSEKSRLPFIIVTPEPEIKSPQDPSTSAIPLHESKSEGDIRPGLDGPEVPGPSKSMDYLRVPSPGPSVSMYSIRTVEPLDIHVSKTGTNVTTCISFETTPPSSDDEYNSGGSDVDE